MHASFVLLTRATIAVACGLLLLSAEAHALAPTVSGAPAWGDGTRCLRMRPPKIDAVSYGFTSPASNTLLGLHVRIEPPRRDKGSPDYQLVTLQSDANGQPSGEILAGTEIATPAGEDPWHYAALDGVEVLQGVVYHVVIEPSDGRPPRGRVCFLAHRDDPPDVSPPWTALARGPDGWASIDARRQWVEPVFLLEFGDGTLWGQPYVGVRTEGVFGAHQLAAQFIGVGGTTIDSVDARLRPRGTGGVLAYDVVDESGMVLRSGAFQPRAAAHPWANGYTAQFLPLALDAGRAYRLIVEAPHVDESSRFVHRTPFTDFPGQLHSPELVARGLQNTSRAADTRQREMPKQTISAAFRAISTTCGNDQLDAGETCDGAFDDACPGRCRGDCTCGQPAPAVCGDGVRDENEVCDGADDQLCTGSCRSDCSCAVPGLPVNVASQAATRASSEDRPATRRDAVDGVVGGAPANPEHEWSARRQGAGAWLELSWASPIWTDKVVLHDRPSRADNIRAARLHFDDGTEIAVDALPTDGAPHTITFPRRVVRRITLLIDAVAGVAGLAEMQVWATNAPPPTATSTPNPIVTATAPGAPTRTVTPQTPTATLGGTPRPTPSPWTATGTVYYLSPGGNDANSGTSLVKPWRTFSKVFNTNRPLKPGDALILLDGTYTRTTTGFPSIDCRASVGNANSGTATQPIIIRAANERQAALVSDGLQAAFFMQNCAWYQVAGLHVKDALNASATQAGGFPMRLLRVADVWLSRILANEPNRWQNVNPIQIENSERVLIEEPEVYQFHRHGVSIWQSRFVTVRRGYFNSSHLSTSSAVCGATPQCQGGGQWGCCSPIDNHPFGDEAISIYGSSDTVVENCISENGANGFQIHGIANALDPSGSGGRRNKIVGSISYGDEVGVFVGSRRKSPSGPTTEVHNARDTVVRDVVIARGSANQIFARQAANVQVTGATLFGSSNAGFVADSQGGWNCQTDAFRCAGSGALCTSNSQCAGTCDTISGSGCCVRNVEGCSFVARNVLSFGQGGAGFQIEGQGADWAVSGAASATNAAAFYNPSGFGGYTASLEVATPSLQADNLGSIRDASQSIPQAMGLGPNQCLVWVPDASNMKRRGVDGADIGANVLHRYETPIGATDPVLTSAPLWRNSDGRFAGCGAVLAGVNDDPASSCGGVQQRLNIDQNGCHFPTGYVGW